MRALLAAALCLLAASCGGSDGDSPVPPDELTLINAFPNLGFERPLFLTAVPGGNRLAVVTQPGRIFVFENQPETDSAALFLDIRDRVQDGGEEGLLGLAFDPDYTNNGYFYVYYSAAEPRRSVISRFEVGTDPDAAEPASEQVLLEFEQPFSNHNGGMLAFGPDGRLYIASGDGGSGNDPQNNAQSLDTLLGKILRINPQAGNLIPADNPFVGNPDARGEIWAYGLRNPWRFSFDRLTGTLWAGDVGQGAFEEIDIIQKGGNYGWRVYEGNQSNINPDNLPASDFIAPVWTYGRSEGASITGGYVYRGAGLPELRDYYIYADFISGNVWALQYSGMTAVANSKIAEVPNPSSFGEDAAGELYITSFDGSIYKFVEAD